MRTQSRTASIHKSLYSNLTSFIRRPVRKVGAVGGRHVGRGGCGGHNGLADAVGVGDVVDAVELVDRGRDRGPVDIERKDGGCFVVT